jgi:hypothetical protein
VNSIKHVAGFIILLCLVLMGHGLTRYLADGNTQSGWPNNVVRNWEQFGFWTLQGRMVANSAGFGALSNPEVYGGHRAASLYPVFVVKRLFAWTGAGTLAFDVVLCLLVVVSTWVLLGKGRLGWIAGAATGLCPGYIYYQGWLDPNAISLLLGLPFAAIVLPRLSKPSLSVLEVALLILLSAAYTLLNWTTVFAHGIFFACLLARRSLPRSRLALYLVMAGISVAVVGALSVLSKIGGAAGPGQAGAFKDFVAAYTWGPGGYGSGMTTGKAALRLLFANTVGLLPLLLVGAWVLARGEKPADGSRWRSLWPLAAAILGVASMRNYFGVHPWMSVPMLLVGVVCSLRVLVVRESGAAAQTPAPSGRGMLAPAGFLAGCFAYAVVVTLMQRVHNAEAYSLLSMVRDHTVRADVIVLVQATDPQMAADAEVQMCCMDRRVVVLKDLSDWSGWAERAFVVSRAKFEQLPLVATTTPPAAASWPLVQDVLAWYAQRVARRVPGEQHFRFGTTCYLYELSGAPRR